MSEATDGQLQATEQEVSVHGSQQAGQPNLNTTDQFPKPELVAEGSKSEQPVKVEQQNPQLQQSQPESQLQQVESNSFQLAEKETGSFGQQNFSGSKVDVAQPSAVQQNAKQSVGQQAPSGAQDTKKGPSIPFNMLIPILQAHLDRDKDMQLQTVWAKLRRNEVHKDDFLRVIRNIVGDQMLKQAAHKVFLQMQAQAQRNNQANPSQHSLFSQVSAQQMSSGGSAQLHDQKESSGACLHAIHILLIFLSCQGPPNSSTQNASGGAKSNKKSGGQKKSSEAAGSTQPSSKKQKTSGAFQEQSIDQLNDVTAVSGVNIREEEEQLLSAPKEESLASQEARRIAQEEEEKLFLLKGPLLKKLVEIG
nr:unnamed protein product [Digitaria exilis]